MRPNEYQYASGALGASGAVNAIVILSCCTFPKATVYVYGARCLPCSALLMTEPLVLRRSWTRSQLLCKFTVPIYNYIMHVSLQSTTCRVPSLLEDLVVNSVLRMLTSMTVHVSELPALSFFAVSCRSFLGRLSGRQGAVPCRPLRARRHSPGPVRRFRCAVRSWRCVGHVRGESLLLAWVKFLSRSRHLLLVASPLCRVVRVAAERASSCNVSES